MLRESIKANGKTVDLEGLADPECKEISGLPNSKTLIEYSDVFMTRDEKRLSEVRDKLEMEMGVEALVDAAGVASNFQRMVRIADATGIPADSGTYADKADLIEQLNLDQYESAKNTLDKL